MSAMRSCMIAMIYEMYALMPTAMMYFGDGPIKNRIGEQVIHLK